jgi:tripartite-type tricarboxylate transporter receptor subunit TctC
MDLPTTGMRLVLCSALHNNETPNPRKSLDHVLATGGRIAMKSLTTFTRVLAITLAMASLAHAQGAFPARPMTMIVPFAAGGATDLVARVVAERMSQLLGQPVVVENVGGAGGMLGVARVARAEPDGYTMVMGTVGTHAQNQTLYAKPQYNAATDFTPVALIADVPLVLVTRKNLPVDDLQSFIAYTKANHKGMTYASAGAGSAVHIGAVYFNSTIGVDVTHAPYRGAGPAMNDLVGGKVEYMLDILSTARSQIEGNTIKAIAVLQQKRSPALPNVPTADEQGLKGFSAYTWNAIFLPKGAPTQVVKKLNEAVVRASNDPSVVKKLEELGYTIASAEEATPEYLARFVASEIQKWAEPIKASGFKVE